ncbi:MAG: sodium-dependent transporter [Gammaproteobacteria bacterium]
MSEPAAAKTPRKSLHGHWSSRFAFVLAVTGSAVGLGNIWKFPYVAGENGGGAFVLVYLVCVFVVGLPIMMSEILIGRRGRRNPVATMSLLGEEEGSTSRWRIVGVAGVIGGMLILSYYSVIAGWSLAYIGRSLSGAFTGQDAAGISAIFGGMVGDWWTIAGWHTLFMILTVFVVARGVEGGLERAVRFMVPGLLLLMFVLLGYSMTTGYFRQGLSFLFTPDFSALTANSVLAAMGQAFFSLSVGMGSVMAYGAYLPEDTSISKASATVVTADTFIALIAGLAIFPIVFANGLSPGSGPGLVFETLPLAFGNMTGGAVFATVFFLLLSFAAWTSAIGLMEPATAWLVERFRLSRAGAALVIGIAIWALGFGTVLSFNVLSETTFLAGTLFDNLDFLTSNIMLPLGGLLITVFAGWVMCANSTSEELGGAGALYRVWRFLARWIAPVAVILVFLNAVGVLSFT